MGTRGMLPKSPYEDQLNGWPSHRPPKEPPKPAGGTPCPPSTLGDRARGYWEELVSSLAETGRSVSAADSVPLARYCELRVLYENAMAELLRDGAPQLLVTGARGDMKKNPAFQILRDVTSAMAALEDRFGMSPAARARVPEPEIDEDDEDDDLD